MYIVYVAYFLIIMYKIFSVTSFIIATFRLWRAYVLWQPRAVLDSFILAFVL